ncbi:hypothetical protein T265_13874, partial [Opisthorchis viverrini]
FSDFHIYKKRLHPRYLYKLLSEAKQVLASRPNIQRASTSISKQITVVGDLHGQLADLQTILHKNGLPDVTNPYIFNGDFVDRGRCSVETMVIILTLMLLRPTAVYLNRGNHEDYYVNCQYGFVKEIQKKYKDCSSNPTSASRLSLSSLGQPGNIPALVQPSGGVAFWHRKSATFERFRMALSYCLVQLRSQAGPIVKCFTDLFRYLPLATIINDKMLVTHGGISSEMDLTVLKSLDRTAVNTEGKHWTRVSLLLELTSSAYPMAVSRFEPRTSDMRGKRVTTTHHQRTLDASELSRLNRRTCSHLSDVIGVPDSSNDDPFVTLLKPFNKSAFDIEEKRQDLLWSDPVAQMGTRPNELRGLGCFFGPDVSKAFLQKMNLQLLIRSHECRPEGFEWMHENRVLTIFSASNYYTEGSNKGAYAKILSDGTVHPVQFTVSGGRKHKSMRQRINSAEEAALMDLKKKIVVHSDELLKEFHAADPDRTGQITLSAWITAMQNVLELKLPWRTLQPRLTDTAKEKHMVLYGTMFEKTKVSNSLTKAPAPLTEELYKQRDTLEGIFRAMDKDGSAWQLDCKRFVTNRSLIGLLRGGIHPLNPALTMSPRLVTKRLQSNRQARRTDQQPDIPGSSILTSFGCHSLHGHQPSTGGVTGIPAWKAYSTNNTQTLCDLFHAFASSHGLFPRVYTKCLDSTTDNCEPPVWRVGDVKLLFPLILQAYSLEFTPSHISLAEFQAACLRLPNRAHIDEKSISDMARSIDLNKDGEIDFNEFLEAFRLAELEVGKREQDSEDVYFED